MTDPAHRLREALASGDLAAAQEAFRVLEATVLGLIEGRRQRHLGRLIDMGQAAAEMAHELRQPLSAVKSFAQMITLMPELPDKIATRAGLILENAERMEAYVERLNRYGRGSASAGELEPCDLNDAVEAAIALLRIDRKQTIVLERVLDPELPVINADAIGLQQIFINLLGNARQAIGDQQGRIRVTTRAANGIVEAWVEDNGPGIPPDKRADLFEPFVTHKAEGTGLGLSISRRIAEQHGGTLDLYDRTPGAAFFLRLPATRGT